MGDYENNVTNETTEVNGTTEMTEGVMAAAKPPKNNKKVIIGAAAGVVVVAGAAFLGWKMSQPDPKEVVIAAFKSVYQDERVTPEEEIFGTKELLKAMQETGGETGISVSMVSAGETGLDSFNGSGLSIVSESDMAAKKSGGSMGIQYGGMDLASLDFYMDDTYFKLAVPELSQKVFSLNYADDLAGQIAASPFLGPAVEESGVDMSSIEEYFDYIQTMYDKENQPFNLEALWERYKTGSKAIDDFKAAMTVEKAEKKDLVVDGKTASCKGYYVVITKDAMLQFMDTTSQFFMNDETLKQDMIEYLRQIANLTSAIESDTEMESAEEMQARTWEELAGMLDEAMTDLESALGDIHMAVYVDKQGRLAAINGTTSLIIEEQTADIAFLAELQGGNYLLENVSAKIDVTADGETTNINIVKQGSYDKKVLQDDLSIDFADITLMYTSTYNTEDGTYRLGAEAGDATGPLASLNMSGIYTDVVKGKSFTADFDTIEITAPAIGTMVFDGQVYFKPLDGEVSLPEGEEFDMIAADENAWNEVIMEIYGNVFGLLMSVGQMQ